MAAKKKSSTSGGGLKGFFTRASKSFISGGMFAKEKSTWVAEKMARAGFIFATTMMVVFMPLMFEIAREGQVSVFVWF